MDTIEKLKNYFLVLTSDIESNLDLQETQFIRRYKNLTSYIETENVKSLIGEFTFYTDDSVQENKCQDILRSLQQEILIEQNKIAGKLNNLSVIEAPIWANCLEILNDDTGIINYIRETVYSYNSIDEGKDYLKNLSGKVLKNELLQFELDIGSEEYYKFYDKFSIEDYDKAIQYVKITINNETIEDLNNDNNELSMFYSLFRLFDYSNNNNIYASSFLNIIKTFDKILNSIVKLKFSKKVRRHHKLTDILVAIYGEDSSFFYLLGEDKFVNVMELVARRNIYIHNDGLINSDYLNYGAFIGCPERWNLAGYSCGDFAPIDSDYYYESLGLIKGIITQLS